MGGEVCAEKLHYLRTLRLPLLQLFWALVGEDASITCLGVCKLKKNRVHKDHSLSLCKRRLLQNLPHSTMFKHPVAILLDDKSLVQH